jgi:hypothetical protein
MKKYLILIISIIELNLKAGDIHISVNSASHTNYGCSYPITYTLSFAATYTAGLKAYKRYTISDAYSQLTEKQTTDFFNAIEDVRFDYITKKAYVSVIFNSNYDDIYIKLTDFSGTQIDANFVNFAYFYDNRKAAVTITGDDWVTANDAKFDTLADLCAARNLWFTPAIITGQPVSWSNIQGKINNGYIEIASHSRTHSTTPYGDYDSEIGGSKTDILTNLTMPALSTKGTTQYLYAWVQPFGQSDETVRTKLGQYYYLCSRNVALNRYDFEGWDRANSVFFDVSSSAGYDTPNTLVANNASFDVAYNLGGVYHLAGHPYVVPNFNTGWMKTHLDYIANKKDVWYAGFGHLYLYRYMTRVGGVITVVKL